MPSPCNMGMTAAPTPSTRPAAARLRNRSLPPKSQMSLPGLISIRRERRCRGFAQDRDVRIVLGAQRPRDDDRREPADRGAPGARHGLERAASNEQRIELREERVEIDRRVVNDPIRLAVRPCDVAVKASRDSVADASHGALRDSSPLHVRCRSLGAALHVLTEPVHELRSDVHQRLARGVAMRFVRECHISHRRAVALQREI